MCSDSHDKTLVCDHVTINDEHCPHSVPTHDYKFPFHSTAITGRQYNRPPSADIHFPNPSDLINFTKSDNNISNIRIPHIPIRERFKESKEGGKSCSWGNINRKFNVLILYREPSCFIHSFTKSSR